MAKIVQVWAREIIDSRAVPTLEAYIKLDTGQVGVSSVPAGASTGKLEAVELRDGDPKRFAGKGVLTAVANVNQVIGPALVGADPANQFDIDNKLVSLDGTASKSKLGANAILSVSQATTKAAAAAAGQPLYRWIAQLAQARKVTGAQPTRVPTPIFNMINGGLHGAGNLDFQEFQVIPASSKSFSAALQASAEVYYAIRDSLIRRGAIHSVGDEGGFAPNLFTNTDAFEINLEAVAEAGYKIGQDFFLGVDVAANTLFKNNSYSIRDRSNPLNTASLAALYEEVNEQYHLTYLEDPFHEEDWEGWRALTEKLGDKLMVVGDDLLVTNPERVGRAITQKACNAILVKTNQIGTVTETLDVIKIARDARWKIIVSHRSGETNDWFVADFAVGVGSDFAKFGAPARGERVAKYNRLSAIEAELAVAQQQK